MSLEKIEHRAGICQYDWTDMSDQKRPYRMMRRAELEEQTRRRITESAVALHEERGPAQTSISAIAERAGVRRSTVYRHFPDEDALFAACSSHWRAANPPPDPRSWSSIEDVAERTRTALRTVYAFYATTEAMYVSLLRDEPLVPAVQRRLRDFYGYLGSIQDDLAAGRGLRGRRAQYVRAAIGHALAFATWRSLTHEQGLGNDDAVELMCRLVEDAASSDRP
jgi:AcrR family transcriptional regulator